MNPVWFLRNVANCWRYRGSFRDFLLRLRWTYSGKLPRFLCPRETIVGFRYPSPIGQLRFVVRANRGSDAFIFGEVFDHHYYRLNLPFQPFTILDLGANAGFTAVYFSSVYPGAQLACVEPAPDNLQVLSRNLELNGLKAEVVASAIGVSDGIAVLDMSGMDYGHKIASGSEGRSDRCIEVPTIAMPTLLRHLGWQRVGLLKVDIEGYEKTLFGANCDWMHLVDAMCVECHEGFGESELEILADQFGFLRPRRLPGIWLITRN